ncbi:MAG: hypothetical protein ACKORI_03940, partial [Verrucomicrobiota bacterium]
MIPHRIRALTFILLAVVTAPAADKAPASGDFKLTGDRWTYREGEFTMNGVLLKPEGKGPFPAVLIS